MSRATRLFEKKNQATTTNFDSYPAYRVSLYEDYTQMILTNTIGNTFYANQDKLLDCSIELHKAMLKKDPEFMMKAAIYGRTRNMMRLQPIMAVAFLSTINDKSYFRRAFNEVIKTPNDLIDFMTIVGNIRNGRGLGRAVKGAINNYLNNLDEYRIVKYGSKKKSNWSLRDIIRACHPVPKDKHQGTLFDYIVNNSLYKTHEQILSVEAIKRLDPDAPDYTEKVKYFIERGKLPYEIVTGIIKPNAEIWEYLMKQMPIFALTRHLNTLDRTGVFNKQENVEYVVNKLTNPNIIKNSRMLPFRFSTAYKAFKGPNEISNALKKALDLSIENASIITGKTAWFIDLSGSMQGKYVEVASILALAGLKQSEDSMLLSFSHILSYPRVDRNDSVMNNVEKVLELFGGGTYIGLCLKYLLGEMDSDFECWGGYHPYFPKSLRITEPISVDNIVIITDEQQNLGVPVIEKFRQYKKKVNKDAKLFIINVAPYRYRLTNDNEPGVTFIYGWNDSVLDILKYSIEGSSKHVEYIRNMK